MLEQWREFLSGKECFKETLAMGEVELTRRKTLVLSDIDIINAEITSLKVGRQLFCGVFIALVNTSNCCPIIAMQYLLL